MNFRCEKPRRETFGTERFAVRLDPLTGWAGDVLCDGRCVVEAAETKQVFDVKEGDTWVTGGGTAIESLAVERLAVIRSEAG